MNLKKIRDSRSSEYAFLMLRCLTPKCISSIQESLPNESLYIDVKDPLNSYGIERESHITLLPCIDPSISINQLNEILPDVTTIIPRLINISIFECENYNVLKCDVDSESSILTINSLLSERFKSHSEFEFHPHMTISYLRKEFDFNPLIRDFESPIEVTPVAYDFSYPIEKGYKHCYFTNKLSL